MATKTVASAKRSLKIIVGFTLLFLGVAMVFSPGPGLLTIFVALSILATDFVWARRLLNHLKGQHEKLRGALFTRADKTA